MDWHDRLIDAGRNWDAEIRQALDSADLILLLVSPDFVASDYCFGVEVKRGMERCRKGEAVVIPVILRPVYWEDAPFGKLQALPDGAKPITMWPNQDAGFLGVVEGIRKVVDGILQRG